jgi:hypothetical protein
MPWLRVGLLAKLSAKLPMRHVDYYAALELDPKNRNALVNLRMLGLRPD